MIDGKKQTSNDQRQTMEKYHLEKYVAKIKVVETNFWLRISDAFRLATKGKQQTIDVKKTLHDGKKVHCGKIQDQN